MVNLRKAAASLDLKGYKTQLLPADVMDHLAARDNKNKRVIPRLLQLVLRGILT